MTKVYNPYTGEQLDVIETQPGSLLEDPRTPGQTFNLPRNDRRVMLPSFEVQRWGEETQEMRDNDARLIAENKELFANDREPSIFQLLGEAITENSGSMINEIAQADRDSQNRADDIKRQYEFADRLNRAKTQQYGNVYGGDDFSYAGDESSGVAGGSDYDQGKPGTSAKGKKHRIAFIRLQTKNGNGNLTDTAYYYDFTTFSEVRKQAKQKYPNYTITDTTITPSELSGGGCFTIVEGTRKDPNGATLKRFAIGFGSNFNKSSADARRRLSASIVNWGNVSTVKTGTF